MPTKKKALAEKENMPDPDYVEEFENTTKKGGWH